jgi:hypothetical protein
MSISTIKVARIIRNPFNMRFRIVLIFIVIVLICPNKFNVCALNSGQGLISFFNSRVETRGYSDIAPPGFFSISIFGFKPLCFEFPD